VRICWEYVVPEIQAKDFSFCQRIGAVLHDAIALVEEDALPGVVAGAGRFSQRTNFFNVF